MTRIMTTDTPDPPRPLGRPSSCSTELAAEICERLAAGESLRQICDDGHLPNRSTVFGWLHRDPDFRAMYMVARECGAEALADEVVAMAMAATPKMRTRSGWPLTPRNGPRLISRPNGGQSAPCWRSAAGTAGL
jgi:hypothetical protein